MNRSTFLQTLLAATSLKSIPTSLSNNYRKIYLLQCFVAGFKHYEGPNILEKMHEGDLLALQREPNNAFDKAAIALHFKNQKIGFIPKEFNSMLSILLDTEALSLFGVITHLQPNAKTWENVAIAVYFLQETNINLREHANYLTKIEAPHYRTLKSSDETKKVTLELLSKEKNILIDLDKLPDNDYDFKNELIFYFDPPEGKIFEQRNFLVVDTSFVDDYAENISDKITEIIGADGSQWLEFELQ